MLKQGFQYFSSIPELSLFTGDTLY